MVVCRGDIISIPSNRPSADMTVSWSQSWRSRTQQYYALQYFNISRANESEHDGAIFVQKDMWDHLKGRANVKGDLMEVTVNYDFQYGQRQDGSRRFLVFQNKDNKMYQHRFVETALGNKAANGFETIVETLGFSKSIHPDMISGLAKNFIGDYLHSF